jgi:hypothetical protein
VGRFQLRQFKQVEQKTVVERSTDLFLYGHHIWCARYLKSHLEREHLWVASRPKVDRWAGPSLEREEEVQAVFFKDLQWKEFGGRSKSEELLEGESYFTRKMVSQDHESLFECDERPMLSSIQSIKFKEGEWFIELSSGDSWRARELVWGESPERFLQLFQDKTLLTEQELTGLNQLKGVQALIVEYMWPKNLFTQHLQDQTIEFGKTYFIPLSYSHPHGHFICEWNEADSEKIKLKVCYLMNGEDENEEEVSKKIKGLKKVLEKTFLVSPDFPSEEWVFIEDDMPEVMKWNEKEKYHFSTLASITQRFPLFFLSPHFSFWQDDWNDFVRKYVRQEKNVEHAYRKSDEMIINVSNVSVEEHF